jgi:hypothetical protein
VSFVGAAGVEGVGGSGAVDAPADDAGALVAGTLDGAPVVPQAVTRTAAAKATDRYRRMLVLLAPAVPTA